MNQLKFSLAALFALLPHFQAWGDPALPTLKMTQSGSPLRSGPTVIQLETWSNPDGTQAVEIPNFVSIPNPTIKARIQAKFNEYKPPTGDLEITTQYELLSPALFSYEILYDGMAEGAAYPLNHEGENKILDLRTGEDLQFSSLFESFARDRKKIAGLLSAGASYSKLKRKECPESDPKTWDGTPDELGPIQIRVNAKAKSITFARVYPHALAVCNALWTREIAISKLKSYLKKDSPLLGL